MVKEFRKAAARENNVDKMDIKCETRFNGRRERARNRKCNFSRIGRPSTLSNETLIKHSQRYLCETGPSHFL